MPRQPIAPRLTDKVALLACAVGVFGGGLGLVLFSDYYLALGEGWTRFLLAGLGFIILVTYFGATLPGPRAYRRRPLFWPLLTITAAFPVGLFFVLIRAGIVSMPERVYHYMIPGFIIAPALVTAFHWFLRSLYLRAPR